MQFAPLLCNTCNTINQPYAKFCINCGKSLQYTTSNVSSTNLLQAGHLLHRRYRVLNKLGHGGMGVVYKAADTQLSDRPVVVKEMSSSGLSQSELIEATEAFKKEANLLASLMNSHLPRIYEHFSEGGRWYLIMDFIEGDTLENYQRKKQNKCLPIPEVLDIGIQLCTVFNFLHTHNPPIIFRDLKPANVMRNSSGDIYLIDFGIARLFKPGQTKDTISIGSVGYAPPEQYGKATTTRSDIYSLGATLHELISGDDPLHSPFKFAPLHLPSPWEPLESLIIRMVNVDVVQRPTSMAEVRNELQHIASLQKGDSTSIKTRNFSTKNTPPQQSSSISQPLGITICSYRGHTAAIHDLAWSPDGRHIISAGKTVQVWEASTGRRLCLYEGHSRDILKVFWLSHGSLIASVGKDKTIQVWNPANGKKVMTFRSHSGSFNGAMASPDGQYIATSTNKEIQIWEMKTEKAVFTYQGHTGTINSFAWSPHSQRIASASNDKTVQVWDALTGLNVLTYHGHTGEVLDIEWSPNGNYLASRGNDHTIQMWDSNGGHTRFIYRVQSTLFFSNSILTFSWSPDSQQIASTSRDKTIQIWNAFNGDKNLIYRGHSMPAYQLKWSPDGRRIASAGEDKTIHVWDTSTGNVFYIYQNHRNAVNCLAWSPDSTRIASIGGDTLVDVWQAV